MPRIPRVTPAEPSAHERIMASLEGAAATPAAVEPLDGGVRVEDPEPSPVAPGPTNAQVREWARANDVEVSDSGPIPKAVREAYDTAHKG